MPSEKVDCLSAAGGDNKRTVARINSRGARIRRSADSSAPVTPRNSRKVNVSRTIVPPCPSVDRFEPIIPPRKMQTPHPYPAPPPILFLDSHRSPPPLGHFFHLSAENFSIFATLQPSLERSGIDIPFRSRIERPVATVYGSTKRWQKKKRNKKRGGETR